MTIGFNLSTGYKLRSAARDDPIIETFDSPSWRWEKGGVCGVNACLRHGGKQDDRLCPNSRALDIVPGSWYESQMIEAWNGPAVTLLHF